MSKNTSNTPLSGGAKAAFLSGGADTLRRAWNRLTSRR
jgi:hypothetical protein